MSLITSPKLRIVLSKADSDSFFLMSGRLCIRSYDIADGQVIEVGYFTDRRLVLKCTGKGFFKVVKSEKIPLKKNDSIEIFLFVENFPIYVSALIREGRNMGPFILAKKNGIDYITLVQDGK
jgi:hypothetical protein